MRGTAEYDHALGAHGDGASGRHVSAGAAAPAGLVFLLETGKERQIQYAVAGASRVSVLRPRCYRLCRRIWYTPRPYSCSGAFCSAVPRGKDWEWHPLHAMAIWRAKAGTAEASGANITLSTLGKNKNNCFHRMSPPRIVWQKFMQLYIAISVSYPSLGRL